MGNGWAEGVHPEDFDRCLNTYLSAFENREPFEMEYRLRHVSGDYRWLLDMGTPNYNSNNEFIGYIGHCFDISERKQIEEELRVKTEEQNHFFNTSLDLFCIADTDGFFRRLNPQWQDTLGYSVEELEGKRFLDFVHPDDVESTLSVTSRLISQETIVNFENRYRCKDGSYRWIEWRSTPAGKLIYAAARDISDRKEIESQLRYQGTHDILTGIYNRAFFEEELTRFERGREYPVSIIMADVDGLKLVNDTKGHAFGDQLLKQTAFVLSSVFRAGDVLARIGGDEFGVLLPGTDHSAAESMVLRIKVKLNDHNKTHVELPVQISIGVATAETGNLMKAFSLADQQMYAEKNRRYAES